MVNMKKNAGILVSAFVLMLSLTSLAYAEENVTGVSESATTDSTSGAEKWDKARDEVKERVEMRCELVNKRIDLTIARYESNKEKHIQKYNAIKDKVTGVLNKLEGKEYDVSTVREDLKTLDSMIQDFSSLYRTFIEKLEIAKSYDCGNSDGQFLKALDEARLQLLQVRSKALDIRLFVLETLRPDLSDLKNQEV